MPERFFCAQAAQDRGESLFGTAPTVLRWLLLEHPKAWSAKGLPDDRLAPEVQAHLAKLTQSIARSRALMIRQHHVRHHQLRFFSVLTAERESRTTALSLSCYDDLLGWDAVALTGDSAAQSWTEPLCLVCTHGKHDKCCAKFGHATYTALRKCAAPAVWECSHVGGDRFAANVLCLPHGIYYGHVPPEEAAQLIAKYKAGELSLKHYRGRSCYSRMVQAAEYYIRLESGLLGIDELALLDSMELNPGSRLVRFHSRATGRVHAAEVRVRENAFEARMTCHAKAPQAVRRYELCSYGESSPAQ